MRALKAEASLGRLQTIRDSCEACVLSPPSPPRSSLPLITAEVFPVEPQNPWGSQPQEAGVARCKVTQLPQLWGKAFIFKERVSSPRGGRRFVRELEELSLLYVLETQASSKPVLIHTIESRVICVLTFNRFLKRRERLWWSDR